MSKLTAEQRIERAALTDPGLCSYAGTFARLYGWIDALEAELAAECRAVAVMKDIMLTPYKICDLQPGETYVSRIEQITADAREGRLPAGMYFAPQLPDPPVAPRSAGSEPAVHECLRCLGTGREENGWQDCTKCNGTGRVA